MTKTKMVSKPCSKFTMMKSLLTARIAENYYTADYPDEEVATDDEYGRNAYSFRNENASDLEEYDVENDSDSADDELGGKGFKSFRGRDGLVTTHL